MERRGPSSRGAILRITPGIGKRIHRAVWRHRGFITQWHILPAELEINTACRQNRGVKRNVRLAEVSAESLIIGWTKAVLGVEERGIGTHIKLAPEAPRPFGSK